MVQCVYQVGGFESAVAAAITYVVAFSAFNELQKCCGTAVHRYA